MQKRFSVLCVLLSLAVWLLGCAPPSAAEAPSQPAVVDVAAGNDVQAVAGGELSDGPNGFPLPSTIPVTSDDPIWGNPMAPVTIVEFSDFQCPFCQRAALTMGELRQAYSPDDLRIVFKHNPLEFHKDAKSAAEIGAAIQFIGGSDAFWRYYEELYIRQGAKIDRGSLALAIERTGMSVREVQQVIERSASLKVEGDLALGRELGVKGTPAFFVNGIRISGAQPMRKFAEAIDAELRATSAARERGTLPEQMYAERVAENFVRSPEPMDRPEPTDALDDHQVFNVPVGTSPTRGPKDALVTIVTFSEFQCPFCGRVQPALAQVAQSYPNDVRLVFKHRPLPFHKRAEPSAQFVLEALRQKGEPGFWQAHDALFTQQKNLEDSDLQALASQLNLNPALVMSAIKNQKHAATIQDDLDLADDVRANGTPHFFINGRRLTGAQPFERFDKMIKQELAKARAMVKDGVKSTDVYREILKRAPPPASIPTLSVPAPTQDNPSHGPRNAPVVIQEFLDFQCPFCARAKPTMDDLMKEFPGKIRLVFRHRPLSMHKDAPLAHQAAMEARAQKGDAGFWKMQELIYEDVSDLSRQTLEAHAQKLGLNMTSFRTALAQSKHQAAIDADIKIADAAGITGTPGFVINGYHIGGAQPLSMFKKVVRQALDDIRTGKKVP